jgi:tRNA(Glu) U13 pseudouridine synthase TruD
MSDLEVPEDTEQDVPVGTVEEAAPSFRVISSQDELDRVLSERLKRERAKFADYSSLKTKAEEYDKLADAQRTEAEKLQAKAAEAEARAAALAQKVRAKALRAEVVTLSARLGIVDADVALALIGSQVEFGDDDEPVGIEEALKDLVKSKPFLKAPRFDGAADQGTRSAAVDPATLTMEEYMARRRKQ